MADRLAPVRWAAAGVLATAAVVVLAFSLLQSAPARPAPVQLTPAWARTTEAPPITVHVTGEVAVPGVYVLAGGQRVDDAIRAAGGPTADADLDALNLAARLADGEKIVVPRRAPALAATAAAAPTAPALVTPATAAGRVSLNRATAADLDQLPGIGPVTAQRILDYRARTGGFRRVEELREAKLVNASTYERIKELVTVD